MVKLNRSAGEILKRCDGATAVDAITQDLEHAFETQGLDEEVQSFLAIARSQGWVEAEPDESSRRTDMNATANLPSAPPRRRPAAVAAGRADLSLPAALRVLLQPGRLATHGEELDDRATGSACCAKRVRLAACSAACRAASRWCVTTSKNWSAEAHRPGLLHQPADVRHRPDTSGASTEFKPPGARSHPAVVPGFDARAERLSLAHQARSS